MGVVRGGWQLLPRVNEKVDTTGIGVTTGALSLTVTQIIGEIPFSEPETRGLNSSWMGIRPICLSLFTRDAWYVHSVRIHGHDTDRRRGRPVTLKKVPGNLNPKVCRCPAGSAGADVGTISPGTCLDYAYDKAGAKLAFAFEIRADDFESIHHERD